MYGIFTYIWLNFMVNVGKYIPVPCSYGFRDVQNALNLVSFMTWEIDWQPPEACEVTVNNLRLFF